MVTPKDFVHRLKTLTKPLCSTCFLDTMVYATRISCNKVAQMEVVDFMSLEK